MIVAWAAVGSVACGESRLSRRGIADWILSGTDTALTPERWILERPRDSMDVHPSAAISPRVCRVASDVDSIGGVAVHQYAEFDIPPAPVAPFFPEDTIRLAERRCMLRARWISIDAPDSAAAARYTDSLTSLIAAHTGSPGDTATDVILGHYTTQLRLWRSPSGTFAAAPVFTAHEDSAGSASRAWSVLAAHFAPNAGAPGQTLGPRVESSFGAAPGVDELTLLDALDIVDLAALAPLRRELEARAAAPARYAADSLFVPPDSIVLPALRLLVDSAPRLPAPRRAAALLAADLLVSEAAPSFHAFSELPAFRDTVRLAAFEALGARYDWSEPDAEQVFAHSWLEAAYHADSSSRAGRAAFLRMLSMGGGAGSVCVNGPDQYDAVIAKAEERLRVAPADTAVLHWRLAQAYADRYALASAPRRDEDTFGSERPPASQAPVARRLALAHARIALGTLRDPAARADLWRLTFRVLAGVPFATRFVCVND